MSKPADPRFALPGTRPFSELRYMGIAFQCRPDSRGGEIRHVGLLYHDGDLRQIQLLHLAFHRDLRRELPQRVYGWAEIGMPKERAALVSDLCCLLARKYLGTDSLSYALRYGGGRFDVAKGQFLSEGGHGLTCATFVLAVLRSHGVQLLKWEEWPVRQEDAQWQMDIALKLRAAGADPEHVRKVEEEVGCARFRTEEVAAGGASEALPLGFEKAAREGAALAARMLSPRENPKMPV